MSDKHKVGDVFRMLPLADGSDTVVPFLCLEPKKEYVWMGDSNARGKAVRIPTHIVEGILSGDRPNVNIGNIFKGVYKIWDERYATHDH